MWLYEKMFVHRGHITIEEFEQAKEMEKEQMTKAWKAGDGQHDKVADKKAEQYYNETFGGNNENN
jgi:hypothetical protein